MCVFTKVSGLDGALSPCHHGDKRSPTAWEKEWQLLYQSRWLITDRVCVQVCLSVKGVGKGIRLESKINQCHVVCMPAAVVSLASPLTIISKLQWPHAHTHTCTHRGRQPVSPISKTLASAEKKSPCQMLSWHNNLPLSASWRSNSLSDLFCLPPLNTSSSSVFAPLFPPRYSYNIFPISFFFPACPVQSPSPKKLQSFSESGSWCSASVRNKEFNWRKKNQHFKADNYQGEL